MRDFTINKSLEYKTKNLIPQPFGNQNIRGGVNTFYSASEGIYAGGSFAGYFNRIARWDGFKWNKVGNGIYSDFDIGRPQTRWVFVSSITKYKNELYAGSRGIYESKYYKTVLHKFTNNNWINIKYEREDTYVPWNQTIDIVVHDNFLYLFGYYGRISEYEYRPILKWDGLNLTEVDDGGFSETTCGISTPDGLYVAGSAADFTGNKIKILKPDNSWVEIPNVPQGGEINSMKFINGKLHIAPWGEKLFKYDEESQTWSEVGELTGVRDFLKVNNDIYATGYFENQFGQSISRWDGQNWNPLKDVSDRDYYGIPASWPLVSGSDGLYVGFQFQINNSNLDSGSTVSRWDGENWTAVDSQKSPGTLLPNDPGIYHSNLLSCSEGVYTSGYFTQRIMLWNGDEFISLSGGLNTEYTFNNSFVSHSAGIYKPSFNQGIIFDRWNGSAWETVSNEDIPSSYPIFMEYQPYCQYIKKYNNVMYFTTQRIAGEYSLVQGLYTYDGSEFSLCFEKEYGYPYDRNFVSSSSGIYLVNESLIEKWDGYSITNITPPGLFLHNFIGHNTGISSYEDGICAVFSSEDSALTQSIYTYTNDQWSILKNIDVYVGKNNNPQYYLLHSSCSNGMYLITDNPLIRADDELETSSYSLYLFDGTDIKKLLDTNNTILDLQETPDDIYICGTFDRQAIGICKLSKSQNITKPLIFTTNNVITTNKTSPYKVTLA